MLHLSKSEEPFTSLHHCLSGTGGPLLWDVHSLPGTADPRIPQAVKEARDHTGPGVPAPVSKPLLQDGGSPCSSPVAVGQSPVASWPPAKKVLSPRSGGWTLKSGCQQGLAPRKGSREDPSCLSRPSWLQVSVTLCLSSLCLCPREAPSSVCLRICLVPECTCRWT